MTHRGSELESSCSDHNDNDLFPSINGSPKDNGLFPSITTSRNNDLFPSINNSNVNHRTIHSDEESVDISEHSSVRQFRNIFNKQKISDRSGEFGLERNLFELHFDTSSDIELSTLSHKKDVSLDFSVIDKILISEAQAKDDRFQYLKTYEILKKNRADFGEDASVFDLSLMDDYNKYIKQTEINDLIHQHVAEKHKDNVLSVVKSKDLVENFYHDNKSDDLKWEKSKQKQRIPWYRIDKKRSKKEISTESLFDENDTMPPTNKKLTKYLQRKLKIRHLQMISFGGTLGVGLFLNSGKAFVLAGGFGTLLAFVICGLIVLATMVSFCEMVTFVSVIDGVSGLSSRFVDDSFGFAVGWLYFASFAFGLAGEILASVMMLSYYPDLKITHHKGSIAGFVTLFLSLIVISNLLDVRIFGEIEYISSFIKIVCVLIMIIIMIVLNTGGFGSENLGFKYWQYLKSDFDHNIIFGLFRPSFNLKDNGAKNSRIGIDGDRGRFLSLLTALLVTAYAYSGTEIVCIAACEAKNPRKALPSATRRVFWRILIIYCLSIFLVSLNIYAGDPRLLRYLLGNTSISGDEHENNTYVIDYVGGFNCNSDSTVFGGFGSGSQSPWIVALQSANLCKFSSVSNALLTFFLLSLVVMLNYMLVRGQYILCLFKRKLQRFYLIVTVMEFHIMQFYFQHALASFRIFVYRRKLQLFSRI